MSKTLAEVPPMIDGQPERALPAGAGRYATVRANKP